MAGKSTIGITGMPQPAAYDQIRLTRMESQLGGPRAQMNAAAKGADQADKARRQEEMNKAATQFEALLLQQMLQAMWQTVPKDGLLDGGHEQEYYRDMFSESLAQHLAEKQGVGIKQVLVKDMQRLEEK